MAAEKITRVSLTHIPVSYRKEVGKNAYIDNIGRSRSEWLVRVQTDSGLEGLTLANRFMRGPDGTVAALLDTLKEALIGRTTDELLVLDGDQVTGVGKTVSRAFRDHPWMTNAAFDLVGRVRGISCLDMLGGRVRDLVPAYDTTMYFQDFLDPGKGAAKCAEEAAAAKASGYRQMKIKTGRGGRWMLPEDGMRRDAEVVLAIRDAVGPDFTLLVDANFGYDGRMDLLGRFFEETASANIFWFEEMVTAGVDVYRQMREMQARHAGAKSLLVCGEVDRNPISPVFQDLIDQGLIDGYQPDIVSHGFAGWMELERQLEGSGVKSVPHNFGNGRYGARASVIFGAASKTFVSHEDERQHDHTYKPDGLTFEDGGYRVGEFHGLGLEIDPDIWARDHAAHEIVISA